MEPGTAAPEQLAVLTSRVTRGVERLLRDPGLAPHDRVRLEIDLRFLTSLDLEHPQRAAATLAAYLPRIQAVVERVTPLYLRLHTDISKLAELVESCEVEEPVGRFPLPATETSELIWNQLPAGEVADDQVGPRRQADSSDEPGTRSSDQGPREAWAGLRARAAIGAIGLLCPLIVLASRPLADGMINASIVALAVLAVVGGAAGILTRGLMFPHLLPSSLRHRLQPPPDRFSARLVQAYRASWFSRSDDPIEA